MRSKMTDLDINLDEELDAIQFYKKTSGGLMTRELNQPAPPQAIRAQLDMTQEAFAALMGVSKRTLQEWEQGRRTPQGSAIALLRIAEKHPEVFLSVR